MRSCGISLVCAVLGWLIGVALMEVAVPTRGGPEGGSSMDQGLYLIFVTPFFAIGGAAAGFVGSEITSAIYRRREASNKQRPAEND